MATAGKVTVVVITYNAQDELKECLASLENQDYTRKELVVVNDASTDKTSAFLREFEKLAKVETKITTNQRNLGVAGSRNVGIQLATGDIIAFTDADCVVDRRWISELVEGYKIEGVYAVGGSISNRSTKNVWELIDKGQNFVASQEGYVSFIQGCNMSFDAVTLRKYLFNDEIKYGFEETLLCDYLLNDGYKIYFRPQAVVHHKMRNSLLSLWKSRYRHGMSSVWYRKKQKKLFIYKRHLALLFALLCLPFLLFHFVFFLLSLVLFLAFFFSLIRDEFIYRTKTNKEIVRTCPSLALIELAHFGGSLAGIMKYGILKRSEGKGVSRLTDQSADRGAGERRSD
jgi:glycosyltransferase involved in cell wall biosynthesis